MVGVKVLSWATMECVQFRVYWSTAKFIVRRSKGEGREEYGDIRVEDGEVGRIVI